MHEVELVGANPGREAAPEEVLEVVIREGGERGEHRPALVRAKGHTEQAADLRQRPIGAARVEGREVHAFDQAGDRDALLVADMRDQVRVTQGGERPGKGPALQGDADGLWVARLRDQECAHARAWDHWARQEG